MDVSILTGVEVPRDALPPLRSWPKPEVLMWYWQQLPERETWYCCTYGTYNDPWDRLSTEHCATSTQIILNSEKNTPRGHQARRVLFQKNWKLKTENWKLKTDENSWKAKRVFQFVEFSTSDFSAPYVEIRNWQLCVSLYDQGSFGRTNVTNRARVILFLRPIYGHVIIRVLSISVSSISESFEALYARYGRMAALSILFRPILVIFYTVQYHYPGVVF